MRRRLHLMLIIIAMETPRGHGRSSKHAANLRVSRPQRSSTVAHSAHSPPPPPHPSRETNVVPVDTGAPSRLETTTFIHPSLRPASSGGRGQRSEEFSPLTSLANELLPLICIPHSGLAEES